jgi:hypothetical protein
VVAEVFIPDSIRADVYAGRAGEVVVFCDGGCGTEHRAYYTGETEEDRVATARRYLAAQEGWHIGAEDRCPNCKAGSHG